ncbi:hypothetical protein [Ochrobactrum sp. MC-1LL]|uniref:hypothetical protein n=1 Tax=Ochrobactrum sp. MC-1LL TaxID=2735351 RepID=UPI0014385F93|nr:hypothetical protein [Ochrobactrum sp. MC-1LL]NKE77555.1 hypothetical protein [Ochrobactrum sp. MC-1LL]
MEILRGSLDHPFFPSPPELRRECERVMKPVINAERAQREREKFMEERRKDREASKAIQNGWTPESRARATEKWQSVKAAMQDNRDEENSYDAAMARLQAAAEANGHEFNIDNLTSAPSGSFKQVGRAA